MIRRAIEQGNGRHLLELVLETMQQAGSLDYTRSRAEEEADKAIAALTLLPDSPHKQALIGLANPPSTAVFNRALQSLSAYGRFFMLRCSYHHNFKFPLIALVRK